MSDCYTPTDGEVLEAWAAHNTPDLPTALDLVGAYDAFKRWLAEHDAKVRAEEREKADREPSDAEVMYVAKAIANAAPDVDWEDLSEVETDWYLRDARAALLAAQEVRRA